MSKHFGCVETDHRVADSYSVSVPPPAVPTSPTNSAARLAGEMWPAPSKIRRATSLVNGELSVRRDRGQSNGVGSTVQGDRRHGDLRSHGETPVNLHVERRQAFTLRWRYK